MRLTALARSTSMVLLAVALAALGGCKKKGWVVGKWLLVDDNGKPSVCFQFNKDHTLTVYKTSACKGEPDKLASGKWQLKEEHRLAIQRGSEDVAHLARITEHDEKHFVASGTLQGVLYAVGDKGAQAVLDALRKKGVIKVRELPRALGCDALALSVNEIKKLPAENEPIRVRERDKGLQFHANKKTGDPKVEKIVYALNQDQVDWIAFHLSKAAFAPPGPVARMEEQLGKPQQTLSTGKGQKRQEILMWMVYCADLRGSFNKDVDVTLFSTAGEKKAYYYVSEKIISEIWEEMKQTVADPDAQDTGEDTPAPKKGASKPKAPAAPAKKAAPAKTAPKPTKAKKKKRAGKVGDRPVVSGADEKI